MRNSEMDIFRALGIFYVVMGHYYQPRFLYLPVYSFHMALFFFASGYFFKSIAFFEKFKYLLHKARTLMLPYFVYNVFFALITYIILITLGLKMGLLPDLYNFFIQPFVDGHQYRLFLPAWFVPQLFIVTILFQFIYHNKHNSRIVDLIYFSALLFLTLFCIEWSYGGIKSKIMMITIRTVFCVLFFSIGYFYHKYIETIGYALFTPAKFMLAIGLAIILQSIFKDINYYLVWANFNTKIVYVPILTSILGIYISLFLSRTMNKFLDGNNFVYKIGFNSYHIMANHLLIFFLLNMVIVYFSPTIGISDLSNLWFKVKPEFTWPLFVGAGIIVPVIIAEIIKYVIAVFRYNRSGVHQNEQA